MQYICNCGPNSDDNAIVVFSCGHSFHIYCFLKDALRAITSEQIIACPKCKQPCMCSKESIDKMKQKYKKHLKKQILKTRWEIVKYYLRYTTNRPKLDVYVSRHKHKLNVLKEKLKYVTKLGSIKN